MKDMLVILFWLILAGFGFILMGKIDRFREKHSIMESEDNPERAGEDPGETTCPEMTERGGTTHE